jgi:uncharacterized protein YeeX (DUF496 family)
MKEEVLQAERRYEDLANLKELEEKLEVCKQQMAWAEVTELEGFRNSKAREAAQLEQMREQYEKKMADYTVRRAPTCTALVSFLLT